MVNIDAQKIRLEKAIEQYCFYELSVNEKVTRLKQTVIQKKAFLYNWARNKRFYDAEFWSISVQN